MKNVLGFLSIPLVKFIGIGIIIYFALFSNTNDSASLRNRLSKERVNKNLQDAKEKSRFIISNVRTAQSISKEKIINPDIANKISLEDVTIGTSADVVRCGSEVEISYGIFSDNNLQIKTVSSEKLVVGSNINPIVEKNIFDMKQGGIRNIKIPKGFVTNNNHINEQIKFYNSGIRYQVYLLSLTTNLDTTLSCK